MKAIKLGSPNIEIFREELTKEKKLGEGGYGIVYQGKYRYTSVAIKELKIFGEVPQAVIEEFRKEALIMLQLSPKCPQLVLLHGVCYEQPYSLVMELCSMGSLYNVLRGSQTLTWLQKEKIAKDVVIGLEFLHHNKIIHRDIKSLNVLLKEDFTAKISDYGLAKIKQHSASSSSSKGVAGVLPWMAPELLESEEEDPPYSFASDVYGYGLVLWEMATHKIPFESVKSPALVIKKIIMGAKEPIPPATPLTFSKLINQCRDRDPNQRPSIKTIIHELSSTQHMLLFSDLRSSTESQHSIGLQYLSLSSSSSSTTHLPPVSSSAVRLPYIMAPQMDRELIKFLRHVGFGAQKEAETMLCVKPLLATLKGNLTDCSDRTFTSITAFQYAVWALDFHMWRMIKQHMEYNNQHQLLRAQMEELNDIGTLHEQQGWLIKPGKSINWPLISWTPLIKALKKYVKNYDASDSTQCGNHWRQQVGGAQLTLPAHVINEYSHPSRPFYPCPQWGDTEVSLPRTGVNDWRNNGEYKLGKDFAWCRGDWAAASSAWSTWDGDIDSSRSDFVAVRALWASRIAQVQVLLGSVLDSRAQPSPP